MQADFSAVDPAYFVLVVGALFVHVCYQLSVAVLTHMSAHTLSRKASAKRLLGLGLSYSFGVFAMTVLLLLAVVSFVTIGQSPLDNHPLRVPMLVVTSLLPIIGLVTMFAYFRKGRGTQLWLPRPIAEYLTKRSRKTKSMFEAAMLGGGTIVGELPFLLAPMLLVATVVATQSPAMWLLLIKSYAVLATLPLIAITLYLSSGHSVARVQRWREQSKGFLQWTSGIALVLLTVYLTVLQVGVGV
ncbi:MAG TPA: hypothetical protein PKD68_01625 [Candidatus Saccharibacteria bacterium]|nr:hypothetical protein [Candidatus Saccharibacteria bacterium]